MQEVFFSLNSNKCSIFVDLKRGMDYNRSRPGGEGMERETTCCFTGHRPSKLPWGDREEDPRCQALKRRLAEEVRNAYEKGCRHYICGMAQGCDLYFCEAALELKEEHGEVTVEAAIPFEGQAERWPERDRARRERLLARCDFETVVQHEYDRGCMQRRNRYMVDRSGLLLAAYNGSPGGTMRTIAYAMRQGLRLEIIYL